MAWYVLALSSLMVILASLSIPMAYFVICHHNVTIYLTLYMLIPIFLNIPYY